MLLVLMACASEAPVPDPASPPEGPPSVLVVVLDTVRADRTSLGGAPANRTPQLTAIAEAGTTWTQVTAPGSWTWPSHASLFTGEPPWVHGAHAAGRGEGLAI
jgi:arylsulfatase A-like enzyme